MIDRKKLSVIGMVVQNDTLFEKYDRYIFDNFRIDVFIILKDSEMILNCYKMI